MQCHIILESDITRYDKVDFAIYDKCLCMYSVLGTLLKTWAVAERNHIASPKFGSSDGLLPEGTNLLPEPMLTNYRWGLLTFT